MLKKLLTSAAITSIAVAFSSPATLAIAEDSAISVGVAPGWGWGSKYDYTTTYASPYDSGEKNNASGDGNTNATAIFYSKATGSKSTDSWTSSEGAKYKLPGVALNIGYSNNMFVTEASIYYGMKNEDMYKLQGMQLASGEAPYDANSYYVDDTDADKLVYLAKTPTASGILRTTNLRVTGGVGLQLPNSSIVVPQLMVFAGYNRETAVLTGFTPYGPSADKDLVTKYGMVFGGKAGVKLAISDSGTNITLHYILFRTPEYTDSTTKFTYSDDGVKFGAAGKQLTDSEVKANPNTMSVDTVTKSAGLEHVAMIGISQSF